MSDRPTNSWQDPLNINRCLEARRIAVVGLSSNPARPSYGVAAYLKAAGYEVIPVNPSEESVLGLPCYPDLEAIPGTVDLVNVFRQCEWHFGAKGLWLQLGVINGQALTLAQNAGLACVADLCTKVEHQRRSR